MRQLLVHLCEMLVSIVSDGIAIGSYVMWSSLAKEWRFRVRLDGRLNQRHAE